MSNSNIRHFTHLIAWQKAHKLVYEGYKVLNGLINSTAKF